MTDNYTDGAIVDDVLDAVGWPAALRTIDYTLGTSYPKWWEEIAARQIINDLELISLGFFYVSHQGYAVWEGRSYRAENKRVSSATFTNDMVDLTYELDDTEVYNKIVIKAEYQQTTSYSEPTSETGIASSSVNVMWLHPGYSRYLTFRTVDGERALSWHDLTVTATQGYSACYSTKVISQSANMCKVKCTNICDSMLHSHRIDGKMSYSYQGYTYSESVETIETEHIAEDATSQAKYGIRTKSISLPFRLDAQELADSLANFYLNYYKEPVPRIQMKLIGTTDFLLTQILTRHISDRITVVNTRLGLSADFFINKVAHEVGEGGIHQATWDLIKVSDVTGESHQTVWVLGSSKLGIDTVLDVGD